MKTTAMRTTTTASKIGTVLKVTSGNFIEMYDFFLFGTFATYISKTFFPGQNPYTSLMLTFATFGAGFLMRPLGAIVLGSYIDRVGRRRGLIVTLAIMSLGTAMLAFVPGYETIGLFAPLLVLIGRLLQGFSAGVELGGVSVYLSEIATPGHKGFYVSWQSGSQQAAIIFSALLGFLLNKSLGPEVMAETGWRIPFFVGCLIIPIVFVLRRSLEETAVFTAQKHHPSMAEIWQSIRQNWSIVLLGMMLIVMTTVSFYFITVYTPTFGKNVLHLSGADSLLITLCVGISNLIWLPISGALSDRVGRAPIMLVTAALMALTAYPVISWLVANISFWNMLYAELWLSLLYGWYNGATVAALTEVMPAHVRTVGFSLSYSLATALFGGMTPLISTWLIENTNNNKASPAYWLVFAGVSGLLATWLIYSGAIKTREREGLRSSSYVVPL